MFLVSLERNPGGLIPFKITFKDRDTYVHSKTKQYDKEAMNNLSWVMFPILVGYAVYGASTLCILCRAGTWAGHVPATTPERARAAHVLSLSLRSYYLT